MSFRIAGTTALITGANRGIGRALVEALLERGASTIYATARRPEALADLVASSGGRVVSLRLDVTRPSEVRAAAATARDVRLLVNNAGVVSKLGGELDDPQWMAAGRDEFEVNVMGVLSVTQAFVPILAARPGAAIVNISSVVGLGPVPALVSYSASKAAVHSLTQSTRALLAPQGIYVAGVYPGPIDTDMARDFDLPKVSAASAAHAILDGLEAGREDIFPDPFAEQAAQMFFQDPKGLEKHLAAPLAVEAA